MHGSLVPCNISSNIRSSFTEKPVPLSTHASFSLRLRVAAGTDVWKLLIFLFNYEYLAAESDEVFRLKLLAPLDVVPHSFVQEEQALLKKEV